MQTQQNFGEVKVSFQNSNQGAPSSDNVQDTGEAISFQASHQSPTVKEEAVGPNLERSQSCVEVKIIPSKCKIIIRCNGVVTDNDDTVLLHTGEYIHDGHKARFAIALSELLIGYHQSYSAILNETHVKRFEETGSIFIAEDWEGYRAKTGKSEDTVLEGILELAHERFGIPEGTFTKEQYGEQSLNVLEKNFDKFMTEVVLDGGLSSLFRELVSNGVPLAVCSASSELFVEKALTNAGVHALFNILVCRAVKKTAEGLYNGSDVKQACEALGVSPKQVVMFGDTMNDVGAAKLAGIPLTIIRIPGGLGGANGENARMLGQLHSHPIVSQVETFGTDPGYTKDVISLGKGQRPHVLIVEDFSQVIFDRQLHDGEAVAGYEEIVSA